MHQKHKGIATLLTVMVVCIVVMFILVAWQTRLLTSVNRKESMGDRLKATYAAESKIFDIIERFIQNYPLPAAGTFNLGGGAKLVVQATSGGGMDTLRVSAVWPNASSQIEATRIVTASNESNYDNVEIVLALDCTGSMERCADPSRSDTATCPTRMDKEKEAALMFLDGIQALPSDERSKYLTGVEVFKVETRWLSRSGVSFNPTSDISSLKSAVQASFSRKPSTSSACNFNNPSWWMSGNRNGETNLGSPLVFADDYLKTTEQIKRKQVEILVTDGLPNTANIEPRCQTINCSESVGVEPCKTQTLNMLQCGLADSATSWKPGIRGLRSPGVEVYAVTTLDSPQSQEVGTYNATVNLFKNVNYVKKYYNSADASQLPGILQDIFDEIRTSTTFISIQHIIPSPVH
jgi:hypothetical protein